MTSIPHRVALVLFIGSLAWAGYVSIDTIGGELGLPKRRALAADVARVDKDNVALEEQLERLRREIVAQKERPEVQEALVRDVLGYVRPNEIVLQPRP